MSKLSIYFIKLFNVDNTQIITVVHLYDFIRVVISKNTVSKRIIIYIQIIYDGTERKP